MHPDHKNQMPNQIRVAVAMETKKDVQFGYLTVQKISQGHLALSIRTLA